MGGKGEGISGTTIKDVWTKLRGRGVESGEGGGGGWGQVEWWGQRQTTILEQQ